MTDFDYSNDSVDNSAYLQNVPMSHASVSTTSGTTVSPSPFNQRSNRGSLVTDSLSLKLIPGHASINSQIKSQLPKILIKRKRSEEQDPQNETTTSPTQESAKDNLKCKRSEEQDPQNETTTTSPTQESAKDNLKRKRSEEQDPQNETTTTSPTQESAKKKLKRSEEQDPQNETTTSATQESAKDKNSKDPYLAPYRPVNRIMVIGNEEEVNELKKMNEDLKAKFDSAQSTIIKMKSHSDELMEKVKMYQTYSAKLDNEKISLLKTVHMCRYILTGLNYQLFAIDEQ
nr:MAG: hypothetical protein [Marsupenaeus japonicus endogenous nimavirus]